MTGYCRTVAVTGALILGVVGALPAASTAAAAGCPAVEAIAVPGTTQTTADADPTIPVGVLASILEPLRASSPVPLLTYYVPYPAAIVGGTDGGGYRASKDAGIDATNARLTTIAGTCPRTAFLLTGYSQGADVAGDVAAAIGNDRGVIPARRLLGVALVADPSQAPTGQPTIGLDAPGMGFAGVRSGGFGSLPQRNGLLSVCSPQDYYCNLPQGDLVMRMIGHLGSQLDAADPAGSAQKLATIFMGGLIAPAVAAINHILTLVTDPNLVPNLIQRGVAFAAALAQQLFWLAGPQVAGAATVLVNAVTTVINLVAARAWATIPAAIAAIATQAGTVGAALAQMKDDTATLNVSGFGPVGAGLASPRGNLADLATAILDAISTATEGLGTQSTGVFGPTFAQFSATTVASALKHYADFIAGGVHESYTSTALDRAGHSGAQIVQRYLVNQIHKLV